MKNQYFKFASLFFFIVISNAIISQYKPTSKPTYWSAVWSEYNSPEFFLSIAASSPHGFKHPVLALQYRQFFHIHFTCHYSKPETGKKNKNFIRKKNHFWSIYFFTFFKMVHESMTTAKVQEQAPDFTVLILTRQQPLLTANSSK